MNYLSGVILTFIIQMVVAGLFTWGFYLLVPIEHPIMLLLVWWVALVFIVLVTIAIGYTFFPKLVRGEFSNRNPWGA